jgi:type IV pilus assembly protein PilB
MARLGVLHNVLLRTGVVDEAGLERAVDVQAREGGTLGRALATIGLADEEKVCTALAEGLHLEYQPPVDEAAPAPTAGPVPIPAVLCVDRLIVPLGLESDRLRLAMANPLDYRTIQEVEFRTGKHVVGVVASETTVRALLVRLGLLAPVAQSVDELMRSPAPAGEVDWESGDEEEEAASEAERAPIIRLVNTVLSDAAHAGASDVHVEPHETHLQVRQRVDGMLEDVLKVPRELQPAVISRLKIVTGMDIAERRKPQDGRSTLRLGDRRIDLRISSLPTQFGEKIVVRLLDGKRAQADLDQLSLTPQNLQDFTRMLARPQGMVLVAAPTGSGKTSTLYAALRHLCSTTKNIITVEDPIEYRLEGVNQVQINTKAGVTFASGLRSILRQDPNIVLVGEIRDSETANIALEAAQTGHLLLSTVHANDAPSTITRLLDLGIEPFLLTSSLLGILAQRLVRRPCEARAQPTPPTPHDIERVGGAARLPAEGAWRTGQGCRACNNTGYRGRMAVHELMSFNDEVRLITRRASEDDLRDAARRAGMRTLMEDGLAKAAAGLTTLAELARVVPPDAVREPAARATAPSLPAAERTRDAGTPAAAPGGMARVLVVEDSSIIATVVQYYLELEGLEVLVATDGVQGLAMARREQPDLIVTDLSMPGMDGLALVRALRADPATAAAVLVLTGDTSVESETELIAVGADGYLVKPVEPRRLAAHVRGVLKRRQPSGRA